MIVHPIKRSLFLYLILLSFLFLLISAIPIWAEASSITVNVNDVTLSEGNSGTTTFTFTVSLTNPAGPGGVTFDIATADGTATAGGDYTAQSLTGQTIPMGTSDYSFSVSVNGDTTTEPDETFLVNITNVAGAVAIDGQGVGSIINDDENNTDLSVTISGTDGVPGGVATYTITVANNGPGDGRGVTITDALPAGMTFNAGASTAGWSYVGGSGTYMIGSMSSGATTTVILAADIDSGVTGTLTNTVSVTSIDDDPDPDNNTASYTMNTGLPDIKVSLTHTDNFYQGQTGATYTIVVSNIGTDVSSGMVTLQEILPDGLTVTGYGGNGWLPTADPLALSRSDALAPGNSYPAITLTVNVAPNAPGNVTNIAEVSGGGDVLDENNSVSDPTTIDQAGFTIVPTNLDLEEGGLPGAFTIKLKTPPAATVTIIVSSSDTSEMTVEPGILTFTLVNWDDPQTVTLTPIDDTAVDGEQIAKAVLGTATSTDTIYNGMKPEDVSATIGDNDTKSRSSGRHDSSLSPVWSTTGQAYIYPPQGGKISLNGKVTLDIPANALSGSISLLVKIEQIDPPPALPYGFMINGKAYRFTVNGQEHYQFNRPVTITFSYDPRQVIVGGTPSVYYHDDSASRWMEQGGTISGSTICLKADHFTIYAVLDKKQASESTGNKVGFTDISDSWNKEAIERMSASGTVRGYPDGTFRPNNNVTRAEFTNMLVKALKLEIRYPDRSFSDTGSSWAKESIAAASTLGIIDGYPDGSFKPDDLITREQMAVIAAKAAKLPEASVKIEFSDSNQISHWARTGVMAAVKNRIMQGYPDSAFRPQENATRAEAVSVILNMMK